MRVLITGHCGFIGQHLSAELRHHKHEVAGVDLANVPENRAGVDLTVPGVFSDHLAFHEPDAVIHLAAQVGREFGERDVLHTVTSNVTMCALVGRAAGAAGVPVIYASSSEAYGNWGERMCTERGRTRLPSNLYGLTKRQGEEVLRLYAPQGLRIMRLSMPYGPGAPPGKGRRAMDNIIWQAIHRKPVPIHRGAERSWCWIGDTVAGIRLVLEHGREGIYNVGRDDRPLSMEELARRCCELVGAPESLITLVDPPSHQTVVKRLSTAKLRALGWEPRVELEKGLPRMVSWLRHFDAEGNFHGRGRAREAIYAR